MLAPGSGRVLRVPITAGAVILAGEEVATRAEPKGAPVGYSFLYNVRRDRKPAAQFTLDWKAEQGYRGLKAATSRGMSSGRC